MANWFDNIPVPMDADGEVVPLTTKVVYDKDGAELTVSSFDFKSDGYNNGWTVFCALGPNLMAQPYGSQELHLHRPDSFKKLEEDLNRVVTNNGEFSTSSCAYANQRRRDVCDGCKLYNDSSEVICMHKMFEDIVSRIHKLAAKDGE